VARVPATAATSPPAAAGYFQVSPPGSALPTDAQCAAQVHNSAWEPRAANQIANSTIVPQPNTLGNFSQWSATWNATYKPRIDGAFSGTTDEIIQWVACKWGWSDNLVRAEAVAESNWYQNAKTAAGVPIANEGFGDYTSNAALCAVGYTPPCPTSFGIIQVKWFFHPGDGTAANPPSTSPLSSFPNVGNSTAFNLDLQVAEMRGCYDGMSTYLGNTRGNIWGCIQSWNTGAWSPNGGSYSKTVQSLEASEPWLTWPDQSGTETTTTATTTTTLPPSTTTTTTTLPPTTTSTSTSTSTSTTTSTSTSTSTSTTSTTVLPSAQSIGFTSLAPVAAGVGGAGYVVSASATSGLPVLFTIDASSTSGCSVSGSMVSFPAPAGMCVIDANQAGNGSFSSAPQVQQSFRVGDAVVGDFNGDGATDIAIFRPSTGDWWINGQSTSVNWGTSGDIPVAGDYNADGKTDIAIFRPSTGDWWINGQSTATNWGTAGDIPVPGDYNGDGKTDIAIFRPSTGDWWILENGVAQPAVNWGTSGDIPVPGDYNGDGKTDIAIYRPATGTWWINGQPPVQWGAPGDIPVPGDYNGDGKTDIAIFRPSTGDWWILENGVAQPAVNWGTSGDIPVPGDYNADGKTDIAIYRPATGTWWINGQPSVNWGQTGDIPIPQPPDN
jgi:hypothetical protein